MAPGTVPRYAPVRADVPVLVGTWGQQTAHTAARFAAEIKVGGSANPAMAKTMRAWLDDATPADDQAGVVLGAVTVVDEDGALARRVARTEIAMYLAVVAALDPNVDIDPELLARIQRHVASQEHDLAGGDLLGRRVLPLLRR
ncbi:hypothetical protein [Micromonospora sp. KLBMP9576]|uniref:hypothetical protein n=1 Tax=Micromonospora sp. KLBMP9576 TaxID=3424769 RepID=UPI003D8FAAAD